MNYDNIIYNAAISKGLTSYLAALMVAQAKLETALYTSKTFKENNNAFGYKRYKGSIYQSGSGRISTEGDAYASYSSLKNSALEVAAWIKRRYKNYQNITTPSEYAAQLKKDGYFGGSVSNYIKILEKYFSKIRLKNTLSFAAFALVSIALIIGINKIK